MLVIFFSVSFALFLVSFAGNPSLYPCPGDKKLLAANCHSVSLPPNLCTICPLNHPLDDGKFADCSNIYSKNTQCLAVMNDYVAANPCDHVRINTMANINAGMADWKDWDSLDYFLYSICEQCCDCIPMGADHSHLGQWVTTRGNCPAHAVYDVCAIFPQVTHFRKIGEFKPEFFGVPPACPKLEQWKKSPDFVGWAKKEFTPLESDVKDFLKSLMDAASCSAPRIWNSCFNLESKQKNLGSPGTFDGTGMANPNTGTSNSGQIGGNEQTQSGTQGNAGTNGNGNQSSNKDTTTEQEQMDTNNSSGNSGDSGSSENMQTVEPVTTDTTGTEDLTQSCDGEVRWGCLNWNAQAGACELHGPKCFPTTPPELANCMGEVKWGCQIWDSERRECTKHGLKCFPNTSARFRKTCAFDGLCK